MTSFYYYDKNPSGFCFLVLIRAFVIQTSLGLQNLNMKEKTKRILVVVVKWRHRANGLLSYFTLVCLWCGRTEGGTGVRSRDHQSFSDEWLTNFSWYRTLACACGSPERGASLSLKTAFSLPTPISDWTETLNFSTGIPIVKTFCKRPLFGETVT